MNPGKPKYLAVAEGPSIKELWDRPEFADAMGAVEKIDATPNTTNIVSKVTTPEGLFYTKAYVKSTDDPQRYMARVMREMWFVSRLSQQGIRVPFSVLAQPVIVDGMVATVWQELPGKHLSTEEVDKNILFQLTSGVLSLHQASQIWGTVGLEYEPRTDYSQEAAAVLEKLNVPPDQQKLVRQIAAQYSDDLAAMLEIWPNLTCGLIHSELTPKHVLVVNANQFGFISFDLLKYAPYIYDLNRIIDTWCRWDGVLVPKLVQSVLSTYASGEVIPDAKKELVQLPTLYGLEMKHKLLYAVAQSAKEERYIEIAQRRAQTMFVQGQQEIAMLGKLVAEL